MPAEFTAADKRRFLQVRGDILANPKLYEPALAVLRARCEGFRHRVLMAWESVDVETRHAHARAYSDGDAFQAVWPDDEPDERDRIRRQSYVERMQPPGPDRIRTMQALGEAYLVLLRGGLASEDLLTPVDLTAAAAVLVLTWLLTDERADEHEPGKAFGAWKYGEGDGRWMASLANLRNDAMDGVRRWLELVDEAWVAMQSHPDRDVARVTTSGAEAKAGSGAAKVQEPQDGEWSTPMPKAELMTRLKLKPRSFETFTKSHPLKKHGRQSFQIRLDGMDALTRKKIEGR